MAGSSAASRTLQGVVVQQLPYDPKAYRYREPGDWNRYRKIKYLQARLRRYPEPLLRHYLEVNQKP